MSKLESEGVNTRKKMEDLLEEGVKWYVFQKEYDWGMVLILPMDDDDFRHCQIKGLRREEVELSTRLMQRFNPRMMDLGEKLNEYVKEFVEVGKIVGLARLKMEMISMDEMMEYEIEELLEGSVSQE